MVRIVPVYVSNLKFEKMTCAMRMVVSGLFVSSFVPLLSKNPLNYDWGDATHCGDCAWRPSLGEKNGCACAFGFFILQWVFSMSLLTDVSELNANAQLQNRQISNVKTLSFYTFSMRGLMTVFVC